MRTDLYELLVERPRYASSTKHRRARLAAILGPLDEDARSYASATLQGRDRHLNENLAPLRRFLLSNVGRPWSKVRSEIRSVCDRSSTVKNHVWQHIEQYVEENVILRDRAPWTQRYSGWEPLLARNDEMPLWVCPRSGSLRRAPRRPVDDGARFGVAVRLHRSAEVREIGGKPTFVTLAPIPEDPLRRATIFDPLLGTTLTAALFDHRHAFRRLFGREDAYAVNMREAGRREAKALALRRTA